MNLRNRLNEAGWTKVGAFGVLLSATIGALSFEAVLRLIPEGASAAIPWILVSLFILPLAYSTQHLLKIWELKEQDGLSRDEKRRLVPIIDGKARQLLITSLYYVVSAVIIAMLFTISSGNAALLRIAIIIAGGLLGISICSIPFIFLESKELIEFKAKLSERTAKKAKLKAALKRLKPKN